jgi:hypothetical protein
MFESCRKNVGLLLKTGGNFYIKVWVKLYKVFIVGKNHNFITFLPPRFLQSFSTHLPLLISPFSPLSTTPITITNNLIKKGLK